MLKKFQLTEKGFRTKFFQTKAESGETANHFMTCYLTQWMEKHPDIRKGFDSLWDLIVQEQFINLGNRDLMTIVKERKVHG